MLENIIVIIIVHICNIENITNSNGESKIYVIRNTWSYNSNGGGDANNSTTYDGIIICSLYWW